MSAVLANLSARSFPLSLAWPEKYGIHVKSLWLEAVHGRVPAWVVHLIPLDAAGSSSQKILAEVIFVSHWEARHCTVYMCESFCLYDKTRDSVSDMS